MLGLYLTYVYFVIIKAPSKEFSMFKKVGYTLLTLLFSYTILGFFALPFLLKSQTIQYVKNTLNKELTIEKITFNPFVFQLHIHNVTLNDEKNKLIAFESLFLDFDLDRTLANQYLHFKTLNLTKPYVNIEVNKNKEVNLLNLIPPTTPQNTPPQEKTTPNELIKLKLDTLEIVGADVMFHDYSGVKVLRADLNDLNYTFKDLSTLKNSLAAQTLSATVNQQGKLLFKGGLSLNPLKTYGNLELKEFLLAPFLETLQEKYAIKFDDKMSLNSKIGFVFTLEENQSFIINNSSVAISHFNIKEKNNQPLLALERFEVNKLNLKFPQTPNTSLLETNFKLLVNKGEVWANALINTNPMSAKADYTLENFPLDIFNPLLSKSMFLDIQSAFLKAKGNLNYENDSLIVNANSSLKDVHINSNNVPIIRAKEIVANNLYFDQIYNVLSIDTMQITSPYVFVQINKNSQLNLANLTKPTPQAKNVAQEDTPFTIYIGPLSIHNGQMTFEDLTLPLHFKLENENINGSLSEFNTKSSKPTLVKLDGNIGKYGHMKLNGDLVHNDFKSFSDFKINFDNIALSDLSGYSSKYIGRKIKEGKLSLDLTYHIEKSKLEAKNNLVISKIKLGEKIQSEKAVSLPLELAIAILEDKNGLIDIKLPLNGNLDDPQFSIAPIVWQAFTNLIAKAITSPFSLLGSLFGFSKDEINHVPFYFGNATITAVQKEPLDKIVQILKSRNKLSIELHPSYDEKNDLLALQELAFQKSMEMGLEKVKKEEYGKEYMALLEKNYTLFNHDIETIKTKHTQDKVFNERFYKQELEQILITKQMIEPSALELLAKNRVLNIEHYLTQQKISKEQIIMVQEVEQKNNNSKFSEIGLKLDTLK